jgi:hydroxymethylbilane synthase
LQLRIERINLKPENFINLDWMIPAPAQGAMLVVAMGNDNFTLDAFHLNDIETEIATYIERQFLKTLEGGCTAPIGALARYNEEKIQFIFKAFYFA